MPKRVKIFHRDPLPRGGASQVPGSITGFLTNVNMPLHLKNSAFKRTFNYFTNLSLLKYAGQELRKEIPVPHSEREEREFARAFAPTTFRRGSGKSRLVPQILRAIS